MEQRMETATPKVVFDLFCLLSREGQEDFLRRLAQISPPEVPFFIVHHLSIQQQFHFSQMIYDTLIRQLFPLLVRQARITVQENPTLSDAEIDMELESEAQKTMDFAVRQIGDLARAELKEQRDRKSDPDTVRRNVEICDLRKQDKRKWSYGMLGRKFDLTKQAIKKVLAEEAKWRRLTTQG
jgi:hypothetical protein